MTNFHNQPYKPGFPDSALTVSREEFYGQDDLHEPLKLNITEGTLPEGIHGHAFIIGPAGSLDSEVLDQLIVRPSGDGTPVFNGDAMIYRLDFDHKLGEVGLKTRMVKTPCFYADRATQPGTEYQELKFDNYGLGRLSTSLGFRNSVNTAFLSMKFPEQDERLLITWDAGRPYEIDPVSLDIVTPIGWKKEWQEQIQLAPPHNFPFGIVTTAAHPCFDPHTNELFTINYTKSTATVLSPSIISDLEAPLEEVKNLLQAIEDLIEKAVASWGGIQIIPLEILHRNREYSPDSDIPQRVKLFGEELKKVLTEESEKGIWGLKNFWEQTQNNLKLIHNVLDAVPTLLNAAQNLKDYVYLIRWDGVGNLQKWQVWLEDGNGQTEPVKIQQSMHQIGMTEDYIILMDTAFKQSAEQILKSPFPDHPQLERLWRSLIDYVELPNTNFYIVRRADLDPAKPNIRARRVVIPREAAHFLADYKNPNDQITLHLAHNSAWDPAEWSHNYDESLYNSPDHRYGMTVGGMDINHLGRYLIDANKGKLCEATVLTNPDYTWAVAISAYRDRTPEGMPIDKIEQIYWNCWGCWQELMTKFIFDKYKNYQYRELPIEEVLEITKQGIKANISRLDTTEMKIADVYEFPWGYFGNSPQFIPRANSNGGSTDGYIICVVSQGDELRHSEIWIFDATNLAQGAVCKLSHPRLHMGMTIHTTWVAAIAPRTASYYIPVEEDYQPQVQHKSEAVQNMFKTKVYPYFPKQNPSLVNS